MFQIVWRNKDDLFYIIAIKKFAINKWKNVGHFL